MREGLQANDRYPYKKRGNTQTRREQRPCDEEELGVTGLRAPKWQGLWGIIRRQGEGMEWILPQNLQKEPDLPPLGFRLLCYHGFKPLGLQ